MNDHAATFDEYYRNSDDPWGFRTRWYERRKRALLRAILPRENYQAAWEIGCSNGELAAALAPACGFLLATDGNERAIKAAGQRLAPFPQASVRPMWVPEDWPDQRFDLIVLSETAYYLSGDTLAEFSRRIIPTLLPGGNFVACHWRPTIAGCAINGDEAHQIMTTALPWPKIVQHLEDDFRLEVWSENGQSVAELEGLR